MDLSLGLSAPFPRAQMFRAFKAAVGTYVEIPELTVSGPISFEIEFATISAGSITLFSLYNDDALDYWGFRLDGGTTPKIYTAGYTPSTGTGPLNDGKLHKVRIDFDGVDTFDTYIDGVFNYSSVHTQPARLLGDFNIVLGARKDSVASNATIFTDGIIKSFSVAGRRYSQFYRPDRIVPNELAQLGALIDLSVPFTLNSPWIQNGATFSIDGSQSSPTTIFYSGVLTPHSTCLCQIKVSDWVSGSVRPENADIELSWASGDGAYEWAFTTATNVNFNIQASSDFIGSVEFTLRDAPGYGVLYNPAEGSEQRYTKKGQAWNGPDLFAGNYLLNGGNPWVDNGDGSFSKVSGAAYGQLALNNLEIGWHLITVTVDSVSDAVRVVRRNADGSYSYVAALGAGRHVIPVEILGDGAPQFWLDGASTSTDAVIRGIKVQKQIPIAPGAM